MKLYKTVKIDESNEVKIYGDGEWIEIEYEKPDWMEEENEELEPCFKYRGNTYFLSNFPRIHNNPWSSNPPEWMKEFDVYMSDSFFSGILIKLSDDGEAVQAFMYM